MQIRNSQFDLTKPEVRALLAFVVRDPERSAIYTVRFCPERGTAAATDGHRLAILAADDGVVCEEGADYSVPREVLAAAWRTCPGDGIVSVQLGEINVHATKDLLLFPEPLATLPFAPLVHPFPDVEALVPPMHHDAPVPPAIGIGLRLLASLDAIGKAVAGDEPAIMHLPDCAIGPLLFAVAEWRIVIMPVQLEREDENEEAAS